MIGSEFWDLLGEPAKIIGSAIAGALATMLATRRLQKARTRLNVDIVANHHIGGVPDPVGIRVTFHDKEYDELNVNFVQVTNAGTSEIEDIVLIFSVADGAVKDWFVRGIKPDGAHRAEKTLDEENGYLTVKIDFLNPGEIEEFALVANTRANLQIRSRTKGAHFVDLREKRERAVGIGLKVMKFLPFISGR